MSDPINSPSHYTSGKIEVIDFIEDQKLGFHLGNATKYIARAGKKDASKYVEDLEKSVWYIRREIGRLEAAKDRCGCAPIELDCNFPGCGDIGSHDETTNDRPHHPDNRANDKRDNSHASVPST